MKILFVVLLLFAGLDAKKAVHGPQKIKEEQEYLVKELSNRIQRHFSAKHEETLNYKSGALATALAHLPINDENDALIDNMIAAHFSVNEPGYQSRTPLQWAIDTRRFGFAEKLLELGAKESINHVDKELKMTALDMMPFVKTQLGNNRAQEQAWAKLRNVMIAAGAKRAKELKS